MTTGPDSDYTGVAVIGYAQATKQCVVKMATQVRKDSQSLRTYVLGLLAARPEIGAVLIETNQGGDLWKTVFRGLPVKLITLHQTEAKEVRAAMALSYYQRAGTVVHEGRLPAFEDQATAFPKVAHDDVVDAVVSGVLYFMSRKTVRTSVHSSSYV